MGGISIKRQWPIVSATGLGFKLIERLYYKRRSIGLCVTVSLSAWYVVKLDAFSTDRICKLIEVELLMLNIFFLLIALTFLTAGIVVRYVDIASYIKKLPTLKEAKTSLDYNRGTWSLILAIFWLFIIFWALPYISVLIKVGFIAAVDELLNDTQKLFGKNLGLFILCARIYFLISALVILAGIARIEKILIVQFKRLKMTLAFVAILALAEPLLIKAIFHLN